MVLMNMMFMNKLTTRTGLYHYTQIMTQGKTKVIYNGVPVGKYRHYVIDALYQSIDSILAQSK